MSQLERLRAWYRGPIPRGKTTPLDLLMIQGTRFCNIDCRYCYLPNRTDKATFDLAHLDALIPRLDEAGLLGAELTVLWHAGEPMVLKPDWYRQAFARIDALLAPSGTRPIHNFQTNGLLVSDAWIDLFREWGVRVGVSIDGPADLHDARRVTRDGKGTHAKGLAGLRKLVEAGLAPSAICVLTADALGRADEIYDFFRAEGVPTVGFNVEEIEGPHTTSSLSADGAVEAYRGFLKRIAARGNADGWTMHVRELRTVPLSVFQAPQAPNSTEATALAILSVDVEGRLFTWSPELVDLKDAHGEDYSIGHVSTVDFRALAEDPKFARLESQVRSGVEACARSCGFFDVCGGGAPVNKLFENGGFDTTETLFCRLTRQVVCEVIEDEIEATVHRRRRLRGAPAAPARTGPRPVPRPAPARPRGPMVAGTPMQPGVALLGEAARPGRIHLCNLVPRLDDERYHAGGLVPDFQWRDPTAAENAVLRTRDVAAGPLGFLAVVTPPADLVAPLIEAAARIPNGTPQLQIDTAIREVALERIMAEVGDLYGEGDAAERRLLGVNTAPPGLPTGTVEKDGLLLGLHIDSWFRQPIADRASAPNRLCLNIGREPRYFLFWNLTVMRMLETIGLREGDEGLMTRNLAHRFFDRHPDYPVARLTLHPGEAYIAPTELLAHDATTTGRTSIDINIAMLGRFRYRPAARAGATTVIQTRQGATRERT